MSHTCTVYILCQLETLQQRCSNKCSLRYLQPQSSFFVLYLRELKPFRLLGLQCLFSAVEGEVYQPP